VRSSSRPPRSTRERTAARLGASAVPTFPSSGRGIGRRLEVEAGLAIVTVFLARDRLRAGRSACRTARPLAEIRSVSVRNARAPGAEPGQWPATALGDPSTPHSGGDGLVGVGHHIAGSFVAWPWAARMLERTGWRVGAALAPAPHRGLTGFVAWNMDPEGWQTGRMASGAPPGPRSLAAPHPARPHAFSRCGMAGAERPHPESAWRYVFPLVCIGAASCCSPTPTRSAIAKSAFLIELTHLPLGLVILVAAWSLVELRLSPPDNVAPGRCGTRLTVSGSCCSFYPNLDSRRHQPPLLRTRRSGIATPTLRQALRADYVPNRTSGDAYRYARDHKCT